MIWKPRTSRPHLEPPWKFTSNENIQKVRDIIKGTRIAMLTHVDEKGRLVSKPMATQEVDFDGTVRFMCSWATTPEMVEDLGAALPLEALLREVARVRRWRLRDYLKKVGRDCSLFAASIGAFGLRVVRREQDAELAPLLGQIDARIDAGHIYKTGGAATVARVELNGRPLVVKRYNIKSWLHWLKRFWRPSRAWHSWVEGNRLELLGIATPLPLAVLERRWCWLRGRAYLVTDYCGGEDLIARFTPHVDGCPPEAELAALDRLFAALIRERISHGDFKGHNLFWDDGRWSLIDLDAMRQHAGQSGFARAYARDRARFLRNWPAESALHRLLDARLPRL